MNSTPLINVQNILKEMEKTKKAAAKLAIGSRAQLGQRLLAANVLKATISFSGSGDSGSIDSVDFEYVPGKELPKEAEKVLTDDLESWTYKWLEGTGYDWYNNDGGQGEVVFDLTEVPFKFIGNMEVNEMSSTTVVDEQEVL